MKKFNHIHNTLILLGLSVFLIAGCAPVTHLTLNEIYTNSSPLLKYEVMPSGNVVRTDTMTDKGILFTVGLTDENRIIYIDTRDPNFTLSGFKVQMPLRNRYNSSELYYAPGWGYFFPIKKGWYAGFDYRNKPTAESPILYFFQYQFGE